MRASRSIRRISGSSESSLLIRVSQRSASACRGLCLLWFMLSSLVDGVVLAGLPPLVLHSLLEHPEKLRVSGFDGLAALEVDDDCPAFELAPGDGVRLLGLLFRLFAKPLSIVNRLRVVA